MKRILFILFLHMGGLAFTQAPIDTIVSKIPQSRRILLEEYTGINCNYCPAGHAIANRLQKEFPGEIFTVNIHAGSKAVPYGTSQPDFRTVYGESLMANAQVSSLPSATINRHVFDGKLVLDRSEWERYVREMRQTTAYANLAARAWIDWDTRSIEVETQVYFTGEPAGAEICLHVMVLQNNIRGYQAGGSSNPEQYLGESQYNHTHVLREFVTPMWGETVGSEPAGSFVRKTFSKTLPESIRGIGLDLTNLQILAFISEDKNEIIDVCQAPIHYKGPKYVFRIDNGSQKEENSCEEKVRIGFGLTQVNASASPIKTIGFRCTAGNNEITEFETAVSDSFPYLSTLYVESDPVGIGKLCQEDRVRVKVLSVNGENCEYAGMPELEIPVIKYMNYTASPTVTIHLWQDGFGSETTWKFFDRQGTVLAEDGPYEDISVSTNGKLHTYEVPVAEGCYVFRLYDSKGDGINNGFGNGHFDLSDEAGKILLAHDGKFTDSVSVMLKRTGVSNTVQTEAHGFDISFAPNPAADGIEISLHQDNPGKVAIEIFSLSGNLLVWKDVSFPAGNSRYRLDLSGIESGFYLLRVGNRRESKTLKLMVVR